MIDLAKHTDQRKEFAKQRKRLVQQQDQLAELNCKSCTSKTKNNSNGECEGCNIFEQLLEIGVKLQNVSAGWKERKQSMALTVQRYKDLKEQGIADSKIRKEFGMHTNAFTAWKRENGLLNESKKTKAPAHSEEKPVLEKVEKVLSNESEVLVEKPKTFEDAIKSIDAQMKQAQSKQQENASLTESDIKKMIDELYERKQQIEQLNGQNGQYEQTIIELQQAYDHAQFEIANMQNAMEDLENQMSYLRELLAHYEEAAASNAQSHRLMLNVSALLMQQVQHLSIKNGGDVNENTRAII